MSGYALVITIIKFIKTQEVQEENRDSILICSKLAYRMIENALFCGKNKVKKIVLKTVN